MTECPRCGGLNMDGEAHVCRQVAPARDRRRLLADGLLVAWAAFFALGVLAGVQRGHLAPPHPISLVALVALVAWRVHLARGR